MDWLNAALLSGAVLGLVNIIDSHLVSRRMPSLPAFLLPVGIIAMVYSLVLFLVFPLPENVDAWVLLIAVVSGMLRTASIIIMLYTMIKEEVSRIIPVVYTYPIFVAIMAVPWLGESLHLLEWLAIIIVVAGAVMVSVRPQPSGTTTGQGKPFLLLLLSSLFFALADITSKYVLASLSPWHLLWLTAFCMSSVFLLVSARPHVFKQLGNLKQGKSVLGLLLFNETVALGGIMLSLWAIKMGPVSLVATIMGSRPIFVLAYALILSRVSPLFLEWHHGKRMLALRLVATAMIVGGITIITLT